MVARPQSLQLYATRMGRQLLNRVAGSRALFVVVIIINMTLFSISIIIVTIPMIVIAETWNTLTKSQISH